MNLTITTNGELQWLGDLPKDIDLPLANVRRRRLSTIVPVKPIKRAMFRILRLIFGDRGRVADYSRSWSGPWRATILATGQTETFQHRAEAIGWELEMIQGDLPKFDL